MVTQKKERRPGLEPIKYDRPFRKIKAETAKQPLCAFTIRGGEGPSGEKQKSDGLQGKVQTGGFPDYKHKTHAEGHEEGGGGGRKSNETIT